MGKYFAPLSVFVGGNIALLVVFLFLPAISTAGEQLASDSAAMASTFWNWSLVVGNVKFIVFITFELIVLFLTGKALLKVR